MQEPKAKLIPRGIVEVKGKGQQEVRVQTASHSILTRAAAVPCFVCVVGVIAAILRRLASWRHCLIRRPSALLRVRPAALLRGHVRGREGRSAPPGVSAVTDKARGPHNEAAQSNIAALVAAHCPRPRAPTNPSSRPTTSVLVVCSSFSDATWLLLRTGRRSAAQARRRWDSSMLAI